MREGLTNWLGILCLVGMIPAGVGCSTSRAAKSDKESDQRSVEPIAARADPPNTHVTPNPIQQASFAEPAAKQPAGPLSLDDLLALTRSHNPNLAAAAARVGEAQGRLIQAGLYPNPTVGYSGNQINDGPGTAGQQGGFVSQEFLTGGKRDIAREAALYGVTAADWAATTQWFETQANVKTAYYELATAKLVQRETAAAVRMFSEAIDRTKKLADAGKADAYDVTRLRVEHANNENRATVARQRVATAERLLAVAIGIDRLPESASAELATLPDVLRFEDATVHASQSSPVMAAAAEADQARADLRSAEVKPIPNVQTMTMFAHDYVTRAPMVSVQVGIPLPLWDRNQGNITSARSRTALMQAGVEQVRLRLMERLVTAYQRYDNARQQVERYRTTILPQAASALEQIEKIYDLRGERFTDTLDARRTLAQARIEYAQLQGEVWMIAAEIESIVQSPKHFRSNDSHSLH
jgi:cobalt-zinc-cadmium efflux system outer membrane protein